MDARSAAAASATAPPSSASTAAGDAATSRPGKHIEAEAFQITRALIFLNEEK